jgi:hypothetical protein
VSEYILALIGVALLTLSLAHPPMTRTYAAILGNWVANTGFVLLSGNPTAPLWFAATDVAAAAIILRHPAGRVQAAIGWVYVAQIIAHFVFLVRADEAAAYDYWLLLTRLAWVQLLLLGGWGIGRWGKTVRSRVLRARAEMAGYSGRKGLDR